VFRDGSFFATREVYKNRKRGKKKQEVEEKVSTKKTLISKGFFNKSRSSGEQMSSPSATIEEVRECDDDDDDDDFTLTRSFDKFETASEMNEMYDIMISDMSEKEQTGSVEYALQKEEDGRERER